MIRARIPRLPRLRRPGRAPAPDRDAGFDRRLILPMLVGSVLNPVNSSMLAVALVPVGAAFGAPPSRTVWLVPAPYLATAVGQPVLGRLVDRYGPRRLYLTGTALGGRGRPGRRVGTVPGRADRQPGAARFRHLHGRSPRRCT